jgi:two-component system response regulator NreC
LSMEVKGGQHERIRVLMCDDHALFREGIKAVLSTDSSVEVVGEAADGRQAVESALHLRPNIVVMDVSMPYMVGYEAIRLITKTDKRIKILVLTLHAEEEIIALCLNAGASGYILKDAPAALLIEAIHALHKGGNYLCPLAAKQLIGHYVGGSPSVVTKYDTLSSREREILNLLADALTVKEIASLLNLSTKTVDVHKYNLMRKLDLHNRIDLVKYALNKKLVAFSALNPIATFSLPKAG